MRPADPTTVHAHFLAVVRRGLGRAAPPPRYTLTKRWEIERDPNTHTISAITEIPVWVLEEAR